VTKEVMSIEETADYLSLCRNTVYRLVRRGQIPAKRFGYQWRISRAVLDEFLRSDDKGDGK
jgi:excisionase family DNA binding protein